MAPAVKATRPRARQAGLTLLELLVALTILGILLSVTAGSFLRWRQTLALTEAATQLSQDLARARALSKRNDQNVAVVVTGGATYTVGDQTRQLPAGTAFNSPSATTLTFGPPYGVLNASGLTLPATFPLRSTDNASLSRTVRVLDLFGKTVTQ